MLVALECGCSVEFFSVEHLVNRSERVHLVKVLAEPRRIRQAGLELKAADAVNVRRWLVVDKDIVVVLISLSVLAEVKRGSSLGPRKALARPSKASI